MSDKTYKNILDDGYTTYHEDGSKSVSYKNILDDGVTTYHEDGSKSVTYKNILNDGTTTYHYPNPTAAGYQTNAGIYAPDTGVYAPGFAGGTATPHPGKAGAVEIILTLVCAGLAGAALWWYTDTIPVMMAAGLGLVIIMGIVQRNIHNDFDKQSVWYLWTLILGTLMGFYMVQHKAAGPDNILAAIAFWAMPVVYGLLMLFISYYATGDENDGFLAGFAMVLILVSWFMTIYRNYGNSGYERLFWIVQDVLLLIVLVTALVNLIRALIGCRLSLIAAALTGFFVYQLGEELTGFYGFKMIWEWITGLF